MQSGRFSKSEQIPVGIRAKGGRFRRFIGELGYGFRRIVMDVRRLSVKVVSDAVLREI